MGVGAGADPEPEPWNRLGACMLKRLELVGFKSFADKTQFDFSDGITAIVGPNGSGKSNIVDAVRWILGEQSAKSLRGGEMADVIFNGSSSRRSFGLAEVTMTFDNARQTLATDAPTVQITRRVYRDGEGEYLINQQPSRLKDIKDLFLGSGAGSDAYCSRRPRPSATRSTASASRSCAWPWGWKSTTSSASACRRKRRR
jgi:chromosome segregation ATPase